MLEHISEILPTMSLPSHKIASPKDFIFGGKAVFTIVSRKSGSRFTYRVSQKIDDEGTRHDFYFVSVLTGSNNEEDYTYLGTISRGTWKYGTKSHIGPTAPSSTAFAWFIQHLDSNQVEVFHEGRCGRCGRKLTTPRSISSGFGPECSERKQA